VSDKNAVSAGDTLIMPPDVIQRARLEERLKQLEREFEKAVNLREQSLAAANEYGKLGVRLEGAMAVLREMLATGQGPGGGAPRQEMGKDVNPTETDALAETMATQV
jgi:hypothetical protein